MVNFKYHKILCAGNDFESSCKRTLSFFKKSMLLNYDNLTILTEKSLNGTAREFWPELEDGIGANRQVLGSFITELKGLGVSSLDDLKLVKFGYPSKIFHIIAHILDGFVDIDSAFYNLLEDSHWLSNEMREKIEENLENYWLIYVEATFNLASKAALIHKK